MRRKGLSLLLLTILLLTTTACGIPGTPDEEFNFGKKKEEKVQVTLGRVPSETVISLLRDNAPLIKIIEDSLDLEMQLSFANNYNKIIERMKQEKYEATLLGPMATVRYQDEVETPAYHPVVRPIRFGSDFYRGIIFTHRDSGVEELEDLRNRKMAFVDRDSASGYLFPMATLLEADLKPQADLEELIFTGRHDLVVQSVLNGKVAAGATYKDARRNVLEEGVDPDEVLPVLAESRKITTSPILLQDEFRNRHPELAKKLKKLLINLHEQSEGKTALNRINVDRYITAEFEDYDEVRKVYRMLEKQ